ncbi:putative tripartite ATP-independent periplasmic transporter, DctQ component [Treponema primitia ZAS-2]|uniref:Putative tripartite ATP-independent periplasmic transporter, DctQ component n=1 Tax=Treponema primitia (strain ATCC BAA-887 / DSM 12427 / ZAS-2) TaxID=545694 RepID=F5YKP9_TREPZ|nr:TRAP transporter small permease subunit [Treponema primitia]AEF85962.1 putative tripartite ATP-independent periplasmic transporter, DctQ component [Treponema primitia ZAS-2]
MRALYRSLCKAETVLCGVGFIGLVFLVFLSAILRFFRVSMAWNIDAAMLLLAWTAFLGADIAYRSGQLLGIDLVTRNLPKTMQKICEIFLFLIILFALTVIVFFGIRLAAAEWIRRYQSMPIPYSLVTLSIVVAAASMILSTILKIKRCILSFNKDDAEKPAGQAGLT